MNYIQVRISIILCIGKHPSLNILNFHSTFSICGISDYTQLSYLLLFSTPKFCFDEMNTPFDFLILAQRWSSCPWDVKRNRREN